MWLSNHACIGSGRRWNSRQPSHRAFVPSIHCSFCSATGMLSYIAWTRGFLRAPQGADGVAEEVSQKFFASFVKLG